jgi:hypothetical protein
VPGHDAARGLRLPRRPRAAPLRTAAAPRDRAVRARDRRLPRARGREGDRRGLQRCHLGRAPCASVLSGRPGRRRDRARGGRLVAPLGTAGSSLLATQATVAAPVTRPSSALSTRACVSPPSRVPSSSR